MPRLQKLYNYYVGKHDILNRKLPDPQKPNNKIVTGYPKSIIDTVVGYFAAHPLSYISKSNNERFLSDIKLINYLNNEEDANAEIVKNFSIFGKCYELHYTDKNGHIRFQYYSPLEMYVEKDSRDNIKFGIRYWEEKKDENTKLIKVEAYDHEGMYRLVSTDNGNTFILDSSEEDNQKEHFYDDVPIVIYYNNEEEIGDFETFIPMIDSLDLMLSDSSNELESWVNAYLVLAGYKGTEYEDIQKMKQDGVLLLDDVGQAKFLTKETKTEFQQNFFETIDSLIHEKSATPKLTSEAFASNLSGQALGFKLFGLETKSSVKERKMERALRKRINFIVTMLNKQGKEYQASDIRFNFVRNIPADEAGITDQITKLINILPLETLISWHPKIKEPDTEIKKLKSGLDSSGLDEDLQKRNQQILGAANE
ncbi:phage portal protein [Sutcliffiella sp. NC1]|uniref:phage portal protein n=1 Tax=Sutcliffiella sp. NC1 TaxID=3004096 RepID=UPI0022DDC462|nr:phage portal protein [Sutcliffiella sp. NC1]WBL16368.1 phage portal protein [Sutcliffiella sp. NC1]